MKNSPATAIFFDSNVLVCAELEEQEHHEEAKSLRDLALTGQITACISPQVLSEFFSVVTHQGRGGPEHPLSPAAAGELVKNYHESEDIILICPGAQTIPLMLSLLEAHPVSGPRIHDLRLAATMLENGVNQIATYDTHVFAHLPGITVVAPSDLIREVEAAEAENEE